MATTTCRWRASSVRGRTNWCSNGSSAIRPRPGRPSWSTSMSSRTASACTRRSATGVPRSSSSRSVSLNPGVRYFGVTSLLDFALRHRLLLFPCERHCARETVSDTIVLPSSRRRPAPNKSVVMLTQNSHKFPRPLEPIIGPRTFNRVDPMDTHRRSFSRGIFV